MEEEAIMAQVMAEEGILEDTIEEVIQMQEEGVQEPTAEKKKKKRRRKKRTRKQKRVESLKQFDDIKEFKSHSVNYADVLVVGPTGYGKTTFIKTMKDLLYKEKFTVGSSTRKPRSYKRLFQVNNKFWSFNFIDTPGFGDNSSMNKLSLRELILKFVMSDVTKLNLVLIAVPFQTRLSDGACREMMNVLEFLGPSIKKNCALLFTKAERATAEDIKSFTGEFAQHQSTKLIYDFCEKGCLFTGAFVGKTEEDKELFKIAQQSRISKILQAALETRPEEIKSLTYQDDRQELSVFSKAAESTVALQAILPELEKLTNNITTLRKFLTVNKPKCNEDYKKQIDTVLEETKQHDRKNMSNIVEGWKRLESQVKAFITVGKELTQRADDSRVIYNEMSRAYETSFRLKSSIVLLEKVPSEPISEDDEYTDDSEDEDSSRDNW